MMAMHMYRVSCRSRNLEWTWTSQSTKMARIRPFISLPSKKCGLMDCKTCWWNLTSWHLSPQIPAKVHVACASQTERPSYLKLPEILVDVLHVVTAELRVLRILVIYVLNLAEQSIRESLAEALFLHGDILRGRRRILHQ